jgi:LysR family glycine cleavage system transcriptional activator
MPRLHTFSKLHPEITINIQSSAEFDDLMAQHIDLAIRFGKDVEQKTPKKYECIHFGDGTVFPVCSVAFLEDLKINNIGDILKSPLIKIGRKSPYDWLEWSEYYASNTINDNTITTSVSSTDMALNAILNKHGFALIVDYLCQSYIETGLLCIPLHLPHPNKVERYFVYDKRSPKKERIHVFIEWVKAQMATEKADL